MKALVFNGPRDIRYEEYADPELRSPNSAILQVSSCSICGSDLHMYHGDAIGSTDYGGDAPKFCCGHEFVGEVVEVGRDVHTHKVGDKVLSAGGTGCGQCSACRVGNPIGCVHSTAFGIGPGLQGGQAELVNIPNADLTLHSMDGLTVEQSLLLTDAMATAYFGLTRAEPKPGGTVAVVGLGPIGLIGVELALLLGAAQVFAIDPVAERRVMAEKLGAIALEPGAELIPTVREMTGGRNVQSVFEASGASGAIAAVLPLVAHGGNVSFVGIPQPDDALSMPLLMFKNVTARGGICNVTATWPHLIPLVRDGRIKATSLFSHEFGLDEGAEAYRLFDSRDDGVIKVRLDV
ncbi:zinc-binding dehydrogenase [Parerythrobacter jejuensis]|uniref:Alcohol dehydrogenase catalytic domain-containing protein n=1 Tax=Parerythrobacter jejuensis TaxID=795812 RepID=A0A845AZN7_9SPHN|nr:alcohol dehydrogenase catalytic domain-containing protein [Parerythrobacter jejuensis]MXP32208.1 alcohol dehydrogenase catalytic domain-containing protein [Parerythrobacter jejuensis]